jgi:hypothetical protein
LGFERVTSDIGRVASTFIQHATINPVPKENRDRGAVGKVIETQKGWAFQLGKTGDSYLLFEKT